MARLMRVAFEGLSLPLDLRTLSSALSQVPGSRGQNSCGATRELDAGLPSAQMIRRLKSSGWAMRLGAIREPFATLGARSISCRR